MRITGTFLDEITHDIPSQNWGPEEWARDFDAMQAVGIDTVILIRAGYRRQATFDSQVLRERMGAFPAYVDLVDLFLGQAERCGMDFFFGTYDSGQYWTHGDHQREVDINRAFCDEVVARYGHRKAFTGWYISHEIDAYDDGMMAVYEQLSNHLRGLKQGPILMSPYVRGVKQFGAKAFSLEQHIAEWEQVFARLQGLVDVVAFQDGQVDYDELPAYLEANRTLAARYGIASWSNIESFDRDMPIKFPPTDFRKLRYKMEMAARAGIEKLITFEFSHFMSPNSIYPAAHHLYRRYREWLQAQRTAG
ncbi:MAG: DUF4434 domain-containing protein [Bacteroidetes bacterium]|nr:MAG: DUF4434 domain-containing protein [Bacteroidota bacterium]